LLSSLVVVLLCQRSAATAVEIIAGIEVLHPMERLIHHGPTGSPPYATGAQICF